MIFSLDVCRLVIGIKAAINIDLMYVAFNPQIVLVALYVMSRFI